GDDAGLQVGSALRLDPIHAHAEDLGARLAAERTQRIHQGLDLWLSQLLADAPGLDLLERPGRELQLVSSRAHQASPRCAAATLRTTCSWLEGGSLGLGAGLSPPS